ncbi:hypothetical protein [Pseudomonas nitroreducens]|uniref:hypothetical protein n=1 Tax=Pseudomonas nitroreducens TaxID=46680 RepID=UPI002D7E2677|nr:hypothetical protein [Pseudomonas nitroreducens]
MRNVITTALVLTAMATAVLGCSSNSAIGRTASTLVASYCRAPEPARAVLRAQIAADTAPNAIRVECAADAL